MGRSLKRHTSLSKAWRQAQCDYAYSGRNRFVTMLLWILSVRINVIKAHVTGKNRQWHVPMQLVVETCAIGFRTKRWIHVGGCHG